MSQPQILRTPKGENLVVLPRADHEALVERADHSAEDAEDIANYGCSKGRIGCGASRRP